MKGIILAGGAGTRLHPMTLVVSKQLLPIYDKPLIYYPLCTLISGGIREVLIITTPRDVELFRTLLGDGSRLGMRFEYAIQPKPEGIAQALIIGKDFIGKDRVALILGDNLFHGPLVPSHHDGATIFAAQVKDPQRYGVVELRNGVATSLVEKPTNPTSNWAVTGLYLYDNDVVEIAAGLKPSPRGELEITDVNRYYLEHDRLHVECLGQGVAWLDTGTPEAMLQASNFVHVIQERQGYQVGSIEEASKAGFLGRLGT